MSGKRGLAGSSAIMFSGTLVSRILGLVRNALLVAAIGATAGQADPFAVANTLPNIIYNLLAGGVLNAVLVPQVVRALRRKDGDEYVNRLLTVAGIGLFVLTVVATAASSLLVTLYASQMDPRWFNLAVAFALWCVPQIFFYGIYTLLGQVLNAKESFGPYMWAPVVNNVVAIAGLIAYLWIFGFARDGSGANPADWTAGRIALLAGTATLGVAVQALACAVALRATGFRFRWRLGVQGLGGASRMALWSFAGLAVAQIGFLMVTNVAAAANGVAATTDMVLPANQTYNNAFLIYMLPQSLFTTSLITALFPRMSDKAAAGNHRGVAADFSTGLGVVGVVTIFAAATLAVLAIPVSHVVLPSVTSVEALNVAMVLTPLALGIPMQGMWSLVQRAFFAYEDARTQFFIQIPMAVGQVVVSLLGWWLAPPQWWVPVAAASIAVSQGIGALLGYVLLARQLPALNHRLVASTFLRLALAGGAAGAVAVALLWWIGLPSGQRPGAAFVTSVLLTAGLGTVMALIYFGLCRLLRVEAADFLLRQVLRLLSTVLRRVSGGRFGSGSETPAPTVGNKTPPPAPSHSSGPAKVGHNGGGKDERMEGDSAVAKDELIAGRYQVEQQADIPASTAGRWWISSDEVLGESVHIFLTANREDAAQVLDSARRASLINDDRLAQIVRADVTEDGHTFVVCSQFPATHMGQACQQLHAGEARAVVATVAGLLEVARRRGTYHLALQPEHIRVTGGGKLIVAGLGIDGALVGFSDDGDPVERSLQAANADAQTLISLWNELTTQTPPAGLAQARSAGAVVAALAPWNQSDLESACEELGVQVYDFKPRWARVEQEVAPAVEVAPVTETTPASEEAPNHEQGDDTAALEEPVRPAPEADPAPDTSPAPDTDVAHAHLAWQPQAEGDLTTAPSFDTVVEIPSQMPVPPATTTPAAFKKDLRRRRESFVARGEAVAAAARRTRDTIRAGATADAAAQAAVHAGERALQAAEKAREVSRKQADMSRTRIDALVSKLDGFAAKHDLNLPGEVEEYDASTPLSRRLVDPSPLILGVFAILLVIALGLAIVNLLPSKSVPAPAPAQASASASSAAASEAPTTAPATAEPTLAPPAIESIDVLDPEGDGEENPDLVGLAFDNDPESIWRSRSYKNPQYGMKKGIGLALHLKESANVSGVTLTLKGSGGHVQVRTDPANPADGDMLAEADMAQTTEITFEATETDTIVLWFTALPKAASDGKNRIELAEIALK